MGPQHRTDCRIASQKFNVLCSSSHDWNSNLQHRHPRDVVSSSHHVQKLQHPLSNHRRSVFFTSPRLEIEIRHQQIDCRWTRKRRHHPVQYVLAGGEGRKGYYILRADVAACVARC
jgi:hypothetical protein